MLETGPPVAHAVRFSILGATQALPTITAAQEETVAKTAYAVVAAEGPEEVDAAAEPPARPVPHPRDLDTKAHIRSPERLDDARHLPACTAATRAPPAHLV